MNKTQRNSKWKLWGDRGETINDISECSILAQKQYKIRHDWVGKIIHWKLCKKLKFDHTNKWYMQNPESVQENETHELFWDFDIQTDHLISAKQPDLIINNKKKRTWRIVDFAVPAGNRVKFKEYRKRDKYLDFGREFFKNVERESGYYNNCNSCSWYGHQRISPNTGGFGNKRTSGDCPNRWALMSSTRILRKVMETW